MTDVLRFLELVRREVDADDARLELGGRSPSDPRLVSVELEGGWRLVACFLEPVPDVEVVRAKLERLATSFSDTLDETRRRAPVPSLSTDRAHALADALDLLREQTHAAAVIVVDMKSPVVWATDSDHAWFDDVDVAYVLARPPAGLPGASPRPQPIPERWLEHASDVEVGRLSWAVDQVRIAPRGRTSVRQAERGVFSRPFGGIYRVVLTFDGSFSELQAEARVLRALPVIERLVLELPPRDPAPSRARVFALHRRP